MPDDPKPHNLTPEELKREADALGEEADELERDHPDHDDDEGVGPVSGVVP